MELVVCKRSPGAGRSHLKAAQRSCSAPVWRGGPALVTRTCPPTQPALSPGLTRRGAAWRALHRARDEGDGGAAGAKDGVGVCRGVATELAAAGGHGLGGGTQVAVIDSAAAVRGKRGGGVQPVSAEAVSKQAGLGRPAG